ncbi:glycine-rich RNA-binding protein 4, mitochondrial isoform X7 [Cynara cardunculus var. scolymus]|uniref:glycine-rich RNA-binding protein 4, mitochondrial isoform X7 n=1 Tax=Cynara cardunculus var. scolymus TaxID=59895 RepID=UPI000D631369|nr:glycine-rich RNA-binding protein 4, mitochondrial isoform X7 [Cynara cardunculus var. scolymus]XP_024981080.1 glycine-rich RNA-binding protein 4, mitochondrial isoform X7 [Cynara cardunculus var. scolymus]
MVSANGVYRISSSSLFRWMSWRHSSSKLFVGGLSYDTNEPVLKDAFGQHGEIIEVKVICDHKSGKSKGYGFVHFVSEDSASKALAEMDDQLLDGRNIRIQYANKKRAPECQET